MKPMRIMGWMVTFDYGQYEFDKYFEATEFAKTLMEHYCGDDDNRKATLAPIYGTEITLEKEDPEELIEVEI